MQDAPIKHLLHQLDLAYARRSWHGPNLKGSLRGTSLEAAAWRPQEARHNIWELVVHAAYWKYRVCRLLAPEQYPTFSIAGSDWFVRPQEATTAAWKQDLDLLDEWHQQLCRAVERFESTRLDDPVGSGEFTYFELISGIISHDVYHAGQIRLIKRMYGEVGSA